MLLDQVLTFLEVVEHIKVGFNLLNYIHVTAENMSLMEDKIAYSWTKKKS